MIGFVTKEAEASLGDVVMLDAEFVAANKVLYSSYLKNRDKYLALEFGRELYEPTDCITVYTNGKPFNLSGGQKEFGEELWGKLRLAIAAMAGQQEAVDA